VFSVFWDREGDDWMDAGMLERAQGPERFDDIRSTIQAIACDTVSLN
jgi:hypothetical protein